MELVTTLLGGSLMGFVTTLIGGIVKAKAEQHKLMLSALNARHKVLQDVREHGQKDLAYPSWYRTSLMAASLYLLSGSHLIQ